MYIALNYMYMHYHYLHVPYVSDLLPQHCMCGVYTCTVSFLIGHLSPSTVCVYICAFTNQAA